MTDPRRWLSVPEAAKVLGISERQTYRLAKQGDIRSKKERGRIWVEVSDYDGKKVESSDQAAEVVRLKQQVENLTEERNYLRQALALSMQNITKLIEAGEQSTTEEPTPARDKPPPAEGQASRWNWRRWPWSK